MTVYHGSNVAVSTPKILKPNRELDFGNGFYTTTNLDQAIGFAKRVTLNRKTGVATVSSYEVDIGPSLGLSAIQGIGGVRMSEEGFSALLTVIVPMVIALIVAEHGLDEKRATERFYSSRIYDELSNESSKLWHYSPKLLFRLYDEETKTGDITYPEEAG